MPGESELALRSQLDVLIAHEAVRQRFYAVCRAMDRLDRELLAAQFWPDAEVDYGVFYKGAIGGFLEIAMGFQGSMRDTHHLVGNVLARVDGATLTAEAYVQANHVIPTPTGNVQLLVGARYLSRLERRDGDWRIIYQTELLDWGRWLPIGDTWFDDNAEMPKGRRDRKDGSYLLQSFPSARPDRS